MERGASGGGHLGTLLPPLFREHQPRARVGLPWGQPGSREMQAEKVAQGHQLWWDMLGVGAALPLGGVHGLLP